MRIAVCDDERALLYTFSEIIGKKYRRSIELFLYESAHELLDASREQNFDLIFVDIVLPDMNGIRAAKELCSHSPQTKVVFLTAYIIEYAEEIFLGIKPYGFIGKPLPTDKVCYYINRLINEKQRENNRLQVMHAGIRHDILMSDIIYIESQGRLANIRRSSEVTAAYEKLDDIEKRLDDRFVRCHQSYIVNLEHVAEMKTSSMVMKNGVELKISRARTAETRQRYFEYKGRTVL